jgi:hypothetical protein
VGIRTEQKGLFLSNMSVTSVEQKTIHVKGRIFSVPSTNVEGRTVITRGKWIRVASVRDEELLEGETTSDPKSFVRELKRVGLKADLFSFAQRIPEIEPKFKYVIQWENVAAIRITSFEEWFKKVAEHSIRKAVNRAERVGVVVKEIEFSDALVEDVHPIYNEVPVRQGKAFWHYGKDTETLKRELGDYLDRSVFLGAFYEGSLIGFMKMSWVGTTGVVMQILSLKQHFDKRPNNALIAKAIRVCEARGMTHFIYGNYIYYDPNSSLTEFKRRNGFESISLPRYYIPLSMKGRMVLRLGLHRSLAEIAPKSLFVLFLRLRRAWFDRKSRAPKATN